MVRPRGVPTYVHFHCAHGFDTRTLARMLDSLVRVSRRAAWGHYASIRANAQTSVQAGPIAPRAITLPGGSYVPATFLEPPEPMLAQPPKSEGGARPPRATAAKF
jgi:hypothetical protein